MPVDYSLYPTDEEPASPGLVLKKARAKTSAGGTLSNNVTASQGAALPQSVDYYGRSNAAQAKAEELSAAPVDYSAIQSFAKQRGEQGNAAMMNALAAQFAGEQFEPVQTQLLKRAAAAQEPIKMAGGLITPEGGFLKDPEAERDKLVKMYSDQAARYAQIAQTADTARDRILAKQREQELMMTARMLGLQIQQQGLQLRAENAALARQQAAQHDADRRDRQLSESTQKLSKQTEDYTGVYSSVKQLNDVLKGYADSNKSIPGIGYGNSSMFATPFLGEQGRKNRAMVQNVLNQIIRADSGQSVSAQEAARQILANMNGPMFSEEDFLNAWENNLLPRVNESFANIGAGYSPEVKQRYRDQGGKIDFNTPFESPRSKKADAGGTYADAEKERRYQEWKKKNGG